MATLIKNNGKRAIGLPDGTLLVPTKSTAISEKMLTTLKETDFGPPGPDGKQGSQLDSLLENHDLELVEGDAEDALEPPADQSKKPADQPKTKAGAAAQTQPAAAAKGTTPTAQTQAKGTAPSSKDNPSK